MNLTELFMLNSNIMQDLWILEVAKLRIFHSPDSTRFDIFYAGLDPKSVTRRANQWFKNSCGFPAICASQCRFPHHTIYYSSESSNLSGVQMDWPRNPHHLTDPWKVIACVLCLTYIMWLVTCARIWNPARSQFREISHLDLPYLFGSESASPPPPQLASTNLAKALVKFPFWKQVRIVSASLYDIMVYLVYFLFLEAMKYWLI